MGGTTLAMHALVRVFAGRVVVMVVHRTARRQQTGGEHNGTCEIAHTHTCATKQSKSARDAPVVAGTVSKRVCCAHKMSTPEVPIAQRIAEVQANMAEAARCAGRAPSEIRLLAVSKKQPAVRLQAAYDAGLRDFGENYLQGLEEHALLFGDDLRWHFIGHLQSKKAKKLAWVHLVHSVDSSKVARLLAQAAGAEGRTLACLLNVNISGEESKSGVSPAALPELLDDIAPYSGIRVEGLMCIPSPDDEPRAAFARLRELRDRCAPRTDFDLKELSMGMSSSYREAIAEGSTIVRVGTAIFGERS